MMVGARVATAAIVALALSPVLMIGNFIIAKPENVEPFITLAVLPPRHGTTTSAGAVEFVSGSDHPAWSVSFYSPDHPNVFPGYSGRDSFCPGGNRTALEGARGIGNLPRGRSAMH